MSELEQKRTGLYVSVDRHSENLGGWDPEDRWTADSYRHTNYLSGNATLADTPNEQQYGWRSDDLIVVGADVKAGDTVYVLWAEYSTGDTFHSEYGCYDMVAGFVSKDLAEDNARRARGHRLNRDTYTGWDMNITLDDGTSFNYHIPWLGYFESLESVHVNSVMVREKSSF